jgi:hypothetical protein
MNETRLSFAEGKMSAEQKQREHREWPPEEAREHMRAARAEMHESLISLFPPEFIEHRRAARKEVLLAARALIDRAIERYNA